MIKFFCHKLGRDKDLDGFKAENATVQYNILNGQELGDALKLKLIEGATEVKETRNTQNVIAELADVLEVVDALCKAYGISLKEVTRVKEKKYQERGGFEKGLFIEFLEMTEDNPMANHFRASPDRYPAVKVLI